MSGAATPALVRGRLVERDAVVGEGAVVVDDGRIVWVGRAADLPPHWATLPNPAGWSAPDTATITPGLVDLHCHGAGGAEFGACVGAPADGRGQNFALDLDRDSDLGRDSDRDLDRRMDAARHAAALHLAHGTTSLVASLVSNTHAELAAGTRALARLVAAGELAGIHLEGPFLSVARRGAQNPDVLTDADPSLVSRLAETVAREGVPSALVHMTMAPERDPGGRLVDALSGAGVLPALGHTDADATTAAAFFARARAGSARGDAADRGGRPLVTHLFNGMPPLHHRDPGPVSAALSAGARGQALLELIVDGRHLAPATVAMVFDTVGPAGVVLVTDAMSACRMPEGRYTLGGKEVVVADGEARLVETDSLAGSVATMADCLRIAVQLAGVPLQDAVTAATATPATVIDGVDTLRGRIAVGAPADLVAFSDDLDVLAVLRAGRSVAA